MELSPQHTQYIILGLCVLIVIILFMIMNIKCKSCYESYRGDCKERFRDQCKERFGAIMDQACAEGNCSNPEGIAAAVAKCKEERTKALPATALKACENPDLEIRNMACGEPCDIESVPAALRMGEPAVAPATSSSTKPK